MTTPIAPTAPISTPSKASARRARVTGFVGVSSSTLAESPEVRTTAGAESTTRSANVLALRTEPPRLRWRRVSGRRRLRRSNVFGSRSSAPSLSFATRLTRARAHPVRLARRRRRRDVVRARPETLDRDRRMARRRRRQLREPRCFAPLVGGALPAKSASSSSDGGRGGGLVRAPAHSMSAMSDGCPTPDLISVTNAGVDDTFANTTIPSSSIA